VRNKTKIQQPNIGQNPKTPPRSYEFLHAYEWHFYVIYGAL